MIKQIFRFTICLVLVVAALSSSQNAVGQSAPNLEAVRDSIYDPGSQYYYDALFLRYEEMDSTLTMTDYHYLYYGYPEQDTYMPLLDNSAKAELEQIMGKRSTPTIADYERAVILAKSILKVEPFNLRDINVLAFLYSKIGYDREASYMMERMEMIAQTIMSTGTGLTEDSPWWVTYMNHAVDVVALMNVDQQTPIILSSTIELIPVAKMPKKKGKGYYFNYSEVYAHGASYLNDYKAPKRELELKPWSVKKDYKL